MSEKLNLPIRPRRNRKSPAVRGLVREVQLNPSDLIYPLFIHEGEDNEPIESTPDRRTRIIMALADTDGNRAEAARKLGVSRSTLYRRMEKLGIC